MFLLIPRKENEDSSFLFIILAGRHYLCNGSGGNQSQPKLLD